MPQARRRHDVPELHGDAAKRRTRRAAARGLLFEMLEGNPMSDGWQDEGVKDALDFCLSCKGCKGECPVNVDMATYKAEFLSHYYERKRRPIAAYAFGLMYWWARIAVARSGRRQRADADAGLRDIAKARRRDRAAAPHSAFRAADVPRVVCAAAARETPASSEVILWPDTWNNHFHPTTAQAAVEVLEDAGFHVIDSRGAALLRPAALRLRHARSRQDDAARDARRVARRRFAPASASSASSRVAFRSFATR